MSGRGPLLDAIRRVRAAIQLGGCWAGDVRADDLRLLIDAAVQSLADADDVLSVAIRHTRHYRQCGCLDDGGGCCDPTCCEQVAVRPVVDDDGTVVEVTALLPEAPR